MPNDLPVARSLTAGELPARLAEITRLGGAALVDVHIEPRRAELRFAAADGVRDRVRALVVAESECCAFLTVHVADEPGARSGPGATMSA